LTSALEPSKSQKACESQKAEAPQSKLLELLKSPKAEIKKTHTKLKQKGPNYSYNPVRLAYQSYFFSKGTVFFSHNKSANSTFQLFSKANMASLACRRKIFMKYEWILFFL
jgi:hypothetical protein